MDPGVMSYGILDGSSSTGGSAAISSGSSSKLSVPELCKPSNQLAALALMVEQSIAEARFKVRCFRGLQGWSSQGFRGFSSF